MEITRTVTETKVSVLGTKYYAVDELLRIALQNDERMKTLPAVSASGEEQLDLEFVTGEDILAMTERVGGTVLNIERDEDGTILSISASIDTAFEYDSEEMGEVLSSLHAMAAPKKILGDLAQTSVGVNVAFTGTTTSGSASVSALSSVVGLSPGLGVTGPGIPANTTILSIAGSTATLSQNATASGSAVALTCVGQQQVICLAEWTLNWSRKTPEASTTDDATYESYLGSSKSWTVDAKFMFVDGDPSQSANILGAVDSLTVDSSTWNFFPTIETGRLAFQGKAIVSGWKMATGIGKCVGLDVTLRGTGPLLRMTQVAPLTTTATSTGLQGLV